MFLRILLDSPLLYRRTLLHGLILRLQRAHVLAVRPFPILRTLGLLLLLFSGGRRPLAGFVVPLPRLLFLSGRMFTGVVALLRGHDVLHEELAGVDT